MQLKYTKAVKWEEKTGSWLSKVWTSSVPSAELFSVYPPQTFSLVQRYLEKKEKENYLNKMLSQPQM